jgi:hypothetical protein
LGFVDDNDRAAEILTMMAHGGGEGKELFGGRDNHAPWEDDETTTKATPQSLRKLQGTDEMTTNGALPSLNKQRGSNAMTTKAISPSLGK